eukprot:511613-Pyramimonas_sp.AAC.1
MPIRRVDLVTAKADETARGRYPTSSSPGAEQLLAPCPPSTASQRALRRFCGPTTMRYSAKCRGPRRAEDQGARRLPC